MNFKCFTDIYVEFNVSCCALGFALLFILRKFITIFVYAKINTASASSFNCCCDLL